MGRIVRVAPRRTKGRSLNYKQVKQVQKIIQKNKQLKNHRAEINTGTVDNTGILNEISAISEGDDFNNRDGDKIQALSIKMHGPVRSDTSATGFTTLRVMICRGKFGPLVIGDMPADTNEQPDLDKMQIYYDRNFTVGHLDTRVVNDVGYYKSFKNSKVPHLLLHYDDDTSATACQSNPLYIFHVSNAATNGPRQTGWIDLKFFNAN